jgi:hypothetical protein
MSEAAGELISTIFARHSAKIAALESLAFQQVA